VIERPLAIGFPQHDEAISLGIGERSEDDSVEQAEDGRGRTDPERKRQDRRNREARAPRQEAPPKADVLD
jgi:hypothetical protein